MNKKSIKIILITLVCVAAVVGLFVLVTKSTLSDTETASASTAEATAAVETAAVSTDAITTSAEPTDSAAGGTQAQNAQEAAEKLIGQTISRDDVQKAVGDWVKFEMTSNGCERGVYAGRFYYDGFTIFSRTYNKGDTFYIVSVNPQ